MKIQPVIYLLALTLLSGACSRESIVTVAAPGTPEAVVPLDLALSLENHSRVVTKASGSLSELSIESPSFRGISSLVIVPFLGEGDKVNAGDSNNDSGMVIMPQIDGIEEGEYDKEASADGQVYHSSLIGKNYAHLYSGEQTFLPSGTGRVLAYGHAIPLETDDEHPNAKHLNGSWIESGFDKTNISAGGITFSPERIFYGSIPTVAQTIADVLNDIAGGDNSYYTQTFYYSSDRTQSSVVVRWDANITSPELKTAFKEFTNNGEMMTGAGKNVAYLLSRLYNALNNYTGATSQEYYKYRVGAEVFDTYLSQESDEKLTYNYMFLRLRQELLDHFEDLKEDGIISITKDINNDWVVSFTGEEQNYPVSLGLPSGSAVLRWNGSKFVVVTEGMEGLASIGSFCYMPPLYYYSNSAIKTSEDRFIYQQYTDQNTWEEILTKYTAGPLVKNASRSVALVQRLQYAPSMLVLTVKAASAMLPDRNGNYCEPKEKNFPVTGIIVGGQYRQGFDFTVDSEAVEEFYVYDRHVSGVYLTPIPSEQVMTLVFPTKVEKDVYFLLELRNDTNKAFYGVDGIILPGGYFYLSGLLEKPKDRDDYDPSDPNQQESVFESDHYTMANCIVETLENALTTIPQLGEAQLILGVQTEESWIYSHGSYVILE